MKRKTVKNLEDLPAMLNVDDVSNVLGICKIKVYELCHSRDFPSIVLGRRILVPKKSFIQWIESSQSY